MVPIIADKISMFDDEGLTEFCILELEMCGKSRVCGNARVTESGVSECLASKVEQEYAPSTLDVSE